jgi:hypothetical protein
LKEDLEVLKEDLEAKDEEVKKLVRNLDWKHDKLCSALVKLEEANKGAAIKKHEDAKLMRRTMI